jgi:hypothetical protein
MLFRFVENNPVRHLVPAESGLGDRVWLGSLRGVRSKILTAGARRGLREVRVFGACRADDAPVAWPAAWMRRAAQQLLILSLETGRRLRWSA